jgi:hypothetical protein
MSKKRSFTKRNKPVKFKKSSSYKSKYRKTLRKRKFGGETDEEIRMRRRREIEDKKMSAIERGEYLKPDNRGPIVNQNLDISDLNRNYNDNIDFEGAKEQGLAFGGKIHRKKQKK